MRCQGAGLVPPGSCGTSFCVLAHADGTVKDVDKLRGLFYKNGSLVTTHSFTDVDLYQKACFPNLVLMLWFCSVCYVFHH